MKQHFIYSTTERGHSTLIFKVWEVKAKGKVYLIGSVTCTHYQHSGAESEVYQLITREKAISKSIQKQIKEKAADQSNHNYGIDRYYNYQFETWFGLKIQGI